MDEPKKNVRDQESVNAERVHHKAALAETVMGHAHHAEPPANLAPEANHFYHSGCSPPTGSNTSATAKDPVCGMPVVPSLWSGREMLTVEERQNCLALRNGQCIDVRMPDSCLARLQIQQPTVIQIDNLIPRLCPTCLIF